MNIYELEKQATPGPWTLAHDSTGYHPEHDGYPVLDGSEQRDEDNALLACHCRNHFMPLLEALKRYDSVVNEPSLGDVITESNRVRALIAKLEEVK